MLAIRTIARPVTALAMSLGLISASAVTLSPQASAASGCSGSRVESRAVKNNSGTTLAWLNVYWDGTYNCAEVQSSGATWGTSKKMGVSIQSCPLSSKGQNGCNAIAFDGDSGTFKYYAGPVRVNGVGKCVAASGEVVMPGDPYVHQAFTSPFVGHC
ncbi:hypothetical protein FHR32_001773 [Streptosporangium album]|uniref:Secreted protein n=1 Tax=Streptosporangium album TaxID=47479 RepID=A0A7W7W815_9ACTN|nr:hypothetical protein [Streptosporangium album]MBB4937468.1 hypothetical protein [Streptosporangium album]